MNIWTLSRSMLTFVAASAIVNSFSSRTVTRLTYAKVEQVKKFAILDHDLSQQTGDPFYDGAASVVIGVILGLTAMLFAAVSDSSYALLAGRASGGKMLRLKVEGPDPAASAADTQWDAIWGPALRIAKGHAADPEIRFRSSAGGATATSSGPASAATSGYRSPGALAIAFSTIASAHGGTSGSTRDGGTGFSRTCW